MIFTRCDKPESKHSTMIITHINLTEEVETVSPPPPDLTSKCKTLQEWLVKICENEKPTGSISWYKFGLFESSNSYTVFLIGLNRYTKEDCSTVRIDFKPSDMFFQLPFRSL